MLPSQDFQQRFDGWNHRIYACKQHCSCMSRTIRRNAVEFLLGVQGVFTFGRDHEKRCAVRYLRKSSDCALVLAVVDAVHDVIERKVIPSSSHPVLVQAFSNGGSGVWEQTGSWLCKLCVEDSDFQSVWHQLAKSSKRIATRKRAKWQWRVSKKLTPNQSLHPRAVRHTSVVRVRWRVNFFR